MSERGSPIDELALHLVEHILLFFSHGLAQHVGIAA